MATNRQISFQNQGLPLTLDGDGFYVNSNGENAWAAADFRNVEVTVSRTGQ